MTITVQGPGGSTVDFPDGTDAGTIDRVMRQAIGGSASPPVSTGKDLAKSAGSGLVSGVEGLAATPSLIPRFGDWLARLPGKAVGMTDEELDRNLAASRGARVLDPQAVTTGAASAAKTGIDAVTGDIADYQPQTKAGEYVKTAGEFAPGLIGGPAGLARRALTNVVAPAAATQAAGDVGKSLGVPESVARFAGGIAGTLLGHGAAGIVSPQTSAPVVEAAGRQGVQVPTSIAAEGMMPQRTGQFLSNAPGVGDPLVKANQRMVEQMGGALDQAATGAGAASRAVAGETAKGGLENWITGESAQQVSDAYNRLDQLIDPKVVTPLNSTMTSLSDIVARRQAARMADGQGPAVGEVLGAATDPQGLTFQGIKDLRTSIGQKLDSGILPAEWNKAELKQIYGALSDDLGTAAQNAGGNAGTAAYQAANQIQRTIAGRREVLAKIVGTEGDAPAETIFNRLQAMASDKGPGNVALLAQARGSVPAQDWQQLSGSIVARLGRDPSGDFSPQRFFTAYGNMSDQGKAILFDNLPSGNLRQSLDDIATISQRIKDVGRFGNPSGTAQTAAGIEGMHLLFSKPLTLLTTVIPGWALSKILARPATAASTARWSSAYARYINSPAPGTLAALHSASRNLAATSADQAGTSFSADDLTKAATQAP